MVNIRQAILNELKRQKKTRNWLAKRAGMVPPSVYQFLNGRNDMSSKRIERLLRILGLEIRPKE